MEASPTSTISINLMMHRLPTTVYYDVDTPFRTMTKTMNAIDLCGYAHHNPMAVQARVNHSFPLKSRRGYRKDLLNPRFLELLHISPPIMKRLQAVPESTGPRGRPHLQTCGLTLTHIPLDRADPSTIG